MTTFLMYLLVKLDTFIKVCYGVFVLFSVGAIASIFAADDTENKKEKEKNEKTAFKSFVISLLFLLIATLLPTTKQAAFIWVAPQIIENGAVKSLVEMTSSQATKDTVANIPELTKLGTEYLKQILKDEINDNKSDKEM